MPELPEVETVVRELSEIEGKTVKTTSVLWDRSIEGSSKQFQKDIKGDTIKSVTRRGKYICINLGSGNIVTVHLRMTGKLVFKPTEKDKNYTRVVFTFKDSSMMSFVDIRKFGKIKWWPKEEAFLPKLGPEPLLSKDVKAALSGLRTQRPVKSVLLDQQIIVGIGNIYADEALFLSGVHPMLPAAKLEPEHIKKLSHAIPKILKQSIKRMGTTLSDYRTTKNIGGENQNYLNAYGQDGLECKTCSATIEKITIGGRSSCYCPQCQVLNI